MKLLALDVATKTGWAVYANGVYSSGVKVLSPIKKGRKLLPDDHPGQKFLEFAVWLHEVLTDYSITHIAYEVTGSQRGGKTNQLLLGLRGVLYGTAAKYEIPILETYPGSLKLHATGHGGASKEDMQKAWMEKFNEDPGTDDECDALWLAHWGVASFQEKDPSLRVLSSKRFHLKSQAK